MYALQTNCITGSEVHPNPTSKMQENKSKAHSLKWRNHLAGTYRTIKSHGTYIVGVYFPEMPRFLLFQHM